MSISHDQDNDAPAGLESAGRDLEIPEAIAEETVGGVIRGIPGNLKWQDIQLKRGITTQ
jgi:hypothetical protein